jgi:hypothetical protein
MSTLRELNRLEETIKSFNLPPLKGEWKGAKVVITQNPRPKSAEGGFYPAPRYVVTKYALELSWLFKKLRDAFYAEDRLDGCSKIEFFGRLANASERSLQNRRHTTAKSLLTDVLQEAFFIYYEMEGDDFHYLQIATGNAILDDYVGKNK